MKSNKQGIKAIVIAAFLVAGTSIGAGMLALPAVTGLSGFLPAIVINFLCWLFMLSTGLLFLEAILWMEPGVNLLSTAERFLGMKGRIVGGAIFLFLYYCLLIAYISGGSPILLQGLGLSGNGIWGNVLFSLIFGAVILIGPWFVNRLNLLLMVGLILAYFLIIQSGASGVSLENLSRMNWNYLFYSAPVLFSAYGYHNIVPSIAMHLRRHAPSLRRAIVIGTLIPFTIYSIWQWLIIGTVDLAGIKQLFDKGLPASSILPEIFTHPWIGILGIYFGFFAIITSFLGVALSMVDFYADGLKMSRKGMSRLFLTLLVIAPSTVFASIRPDLFIFALGIAGGFGESLINGLFPVLMVWVGRYKMGLKSDWTLPGGKGTLVLLIAATVFIVILEFIELLQ